MILCWTGICLFLKSVRLLSPCGILSEFWRVHCLAECRELAFELSLKWILCTFVTRAWKSQVLASDIEKGLMSLPLYGNMCAWLLLHLSVCLTSPLLPGADKQQVQGTDLRLALWALCSWDMDVGCPGGHLTVLFLLCPSFVQSCFPCALSCHTALDQGCRLWVPTPLWLQESCIKDKALTLVPTALLLWSTAGRRVCAAVPALIWSEALLYLPSWALQGVGQCLGTARSSVLGIQYRNTSWHSKTCSVGTVPADAFLGSSLPLMSCPLSLEACPVWQQANVSKQVEFLQAQIISSPLFIIYCPRAKPSDLCLNRYWCTGWDLRTFTRY